MNWWLASCVISAVFALILAFVLAAFWLADRADDLADYERQVDHGDCPWPIGAERDRVSSHHVSDSKR